jgi:hypothetical protein
MVNRGILQHSYPERQPIRGSRPQPGVASKRQGMRGRNAQVWADPTRLWGGGTMPCVHEAAMPTDCLTSHEDPLPRMGSLFIATTRLWKPTQPSLRERNPLNERETSRVARMPSTWRDAPFVAMPVPRNPSVSLLPRPTVGPALNTSPSRHLDSPAHVRASVGGRHGHLLAGGERDRLPGATQASRDIAQ